MHPLEDFKAPINVTVFPLEHYFFACKAYNTSILCASSAPVISDIFLKKSVENEKCMVV